MPVPEHIQRPIRWDFKMQRRLDGHWDCHATASIENPSIELGGFVLEDAATDTGKPTERFQERLSTGISDFMASLKNQEFESRD